MKKPPLLIVVAIIDEIGLECQGKLRKFHSILASCLKPYFIDKKRAFLIIMKSGDA
jgi:hypothetical protein